MHPACLLVTCHYEEQVRILLKEVKITNELISETLMEITPQNSNSYPFNEI